MSNMQDPSPPSLRDKLRDQFVLNRQKTNSSRGRRGTVCTNRGGPGCPEFPKNHCAATVYACPGMGVLAEKLSLQGLGVPAQSEDTMEARREFCLAYERAVEVTWSYHLLSGLVNMGVDLTVVGPTGVPTAHRPRSYRDLGREFGHEHVLACLLAREERPWSQ